MNHSVPCEKCNGSGQYKKFGDCFLCRGSGRRAYVSDGVVKWLGKEYKAGDEVPFLNTRGNIDIGRIIKFYDRDEKQFEAPLKDGVVDINNIWYNLFVIRTGKEERYCLWRTALQAFGDAKPVKVNDKKQKHA